MQTFSRRPGAFCPAWWLPGPHLQTLWPVLCGRRATLPLARESLELPDGDFVDLCRTPGDTGPVVAVFHGLEGSIASPYACGVMQAVHRRGWRGVFMHFRGCGGRPNRLPRSYHSGDTGDIAFLLNTLAARHPEAPLAAVGFSLGGNALLKYLGEGNTPASLRAAVAVSVPFLLAEGAARLERGLSRIYQRHLLARLRDKVRKKFAGGGGPVSPEVLRRLDTFRRFDQCVTAPLHGFTDADDYYARSSCRPFLRRIRVPTLIIHAQDDPFLTATAIPRADELAPCVELELTRRGGHVGFVGGRWPWRAEYWLEQCIPEYLAGCFPSREADAAHR